MCCSNQLNPQPSILSTSSDLRQERGVSLLCSPGFEVRPIAVILNVFLLLLSTRNGGRALAPNYEKPGIAEQLLFARGVTGTSSALHHLLNLECYQESLDYLTPPDVFNGRGQVTPDRREAIKPYAVAICIKMHYDNRRKIKPDELN